MIRIDPFKSNPALRKIFNAVFHNEGAVPQRVGIFKQVSFPSGDVGQFTRCNTSKFVAYSAYFGVDTGSRFQRAERIDTIF